MHSDSDKKNMNEISNPSSAIASKDFDSSLFISKDKNFVFTHQKVKKLAAAVYMITNFFDDHEPIKWSLRSLSTQLLKKNIALTDTIFANSSSTRDSIKEVILETVSLLEVASFAGLVSSMNVEVLKKEFTILLERMELIGNPTSSNGVSTAEQFFAVADPAPVTPSQQKSIPSIYKGETSPAVQIKDNSNVLYSEQLVPTQTDVSDTENRMKLREFSPVAVKKNKRQSAIINLLKRKKEIMIKDVVGIITDCSEKTIQRELLALVDEGVLKKEGERRWTKYSLV
jgi:hypothetical protein